MSYNPPLQVLGFISTRREEEERGPMIALRADEAKLRGVDEHELVWVYGPRRHDLAQVKIDDSVPRGGCVVRDLAGLATTEIVRLIKPTDDRPILTNVV